MAEKKYYWLKLMNDFFDSKRIKKLRKMAGGDTYTIIYLKMQLLSLKNGGIIEYTGLEDEFYKELALDLDEDEINVQATVMYLLSCGLLETSDNVFYSLPFVKNNIGSETSTAIRMRKSREKKKLNDKNCNNVTPQLQNRYGDIDIDKDIDIDININNISIVDCEEVFEAVWKLYPRKEGKGQVSKTKKKVLAKIGVDELTRCVERYKYEKRGSEKKYLQMGSTFFNGGYVDYLDGNYQGTYLVDAEEKTPEEILQEVLAEGN